MNNETEVNKDVCTNEKSRAFTNGGALTGQCLGSRRPDGRLVLQDVIHRLNRKAQNLQTICNSMPAVMSPQQEDALYELALDVERSSTRH